MGHRLRISGTGFELDGTPFDMWGVRLANALENDAATAAVVRALEDYAHHGVNTFSVFLQGGSTGSANPFDGDGAFTRRTRREESSPAFKGRGDVEGIASRNAHLDRLAVLIEAADARGMVVNVGVFYQARIRQLCGEGAVLRAAEDTARWLAGKGYGNVFVDLVNEYGHPGFADMPLCYGRQERYSPDGGDVLLTAFKEIAPDLPAGISDLAPFPARFEHADLVILHEVFSPAEVRDRLGRQVPVVLNEWGFGHVLPASDELNGLYTSEDCARWQQVVATVREGGGYAFYHSSWKQHLTERGGPHFELGPAGAQPQDPRGGVPSDHWYFDLVQRLRGLS